MPKKQEKLHSGDEARLPAQPGDIPSAKREIIQCIEENTDQLLGTIRLYVRRFGLAGRDDMQTVALEVLQEVVVEALAHIENFASPKQPMAWLLGISINVIRRRNVANAKRYSREMQLEHPSSWHEDTSGEENMFLQFIGPITDSPELVVEDEEQVKAMLSLVSEEDQKILRLALLDDLRHDMLARHLKTTPTVTRMRLHRALVRLRAAWHQQHRQSWKGGNDE